MRNAGSAEATELGTEQVRGTAKSGGHLVGGGAGNKVLAVDLYNGLCDSVDGGAHGSEDVEEDLDIAYGGDVFEDATFLIQNAGTDDGKCRVFHTADIYVAVEFVSAVDDDLFHE